MSKKYVYASTLVGLKTDGTYGRPSADGIRVFYSYSSTASPAEPPPTFPSAGDTFVSGTVTFAETDDTLYATGFVGQAIAPIEAENAKPSGETEVRRSCTADRDAGRNARPRLEMPPGFWLRQWSRWFLDDRSFDLVAETILADYQRLYIQAIQRGDVREQYRLRFVYTSSFIWSVCLRRLLTLIITIFRGA